MEPHANVTIDVFVTHTCAGDYNSYYRQRQIKELVKFVNKSDADFALLGGDFNVDPKARKHIDPKDKGTPPSEKSDFFRALPK